MNRDFSKLKKDYPEAFFVSNSKKKGIEELKKAILEYVFGKKIKD